MKVRKAKLNQYRRERRAALLRIEGVRLNMENERSGHVLHLMDLDLQYLRDTLVWLRKDLYR